MPSAVRRRGDAIESAARAHLESAGLRAVAANAAFRVGELDLVMRDGDTLVFVEVRYRRARGFGGGAMSVDARKQHKIASAAQGFLLAHPQWRDAPCRFDVVEADGAGHAPVLHWIRDAFRLA